MFCIKLIITCSLKFVIYVFRIPRPIAIEPLVENDEDDGLPEMFMTRNLDYNKYV